MVLHVPLQLFKLHPGWLGVKHQVTYLLWTKEQSPTSDKLHILSCKIYIYPFHSLWKNSKVPVLGMPQTGWLAGLNPFINTYIFHADPKSDN